MTDLVNTLFSNPDILSSRLVCEFFVVLLIIEVIKSVLQSIGGIRN